MSGRILVVDDSATIRRLVRSILEETGYEVSSAPDGQAALDLLQRESFDVALLDFVMPRLNGYQLAQAIRGIAQLRSLPLVLMSAKADVIGPRFIQQTQAAHSITKPFEPNALLTVVEHALSSRTHQSLRPVTLVNEELGRTRSIPPPSPEPPKTSARPAPRSSMAPSPAARAASSSAPRPTPEFDLNTSAVPRDRAATVVARARLDTAPNVWPSLTEDSEKTVIGVLPIDLDSEVTGEGLAVVEEVEARSDAVRAFADKVADVLARVAPDLASREALASALADGINEEELRAIVASAKRARYAIADCEPPTIEGFIEFVPLGEVLQLLRFQQQTGTLAVRRGDAAVEMCFHRGTIDLALARNASQEFLLGRYAVAAGVLDARELESLLRGGVRGRLGEALIASGRLDAEGLERLLTRQSSEILYEVCRWRDGEFEFFQGVRRPEAEAAALGLPVEALVLEGFRRVDEWGQIEQEVRSFEDVFAVDQGVVESVGLARLSPTERRVLESLDGARTVNDVIAHTHLNSFDVCKTLFQLRRARLIRRRGS